MSSRHALIRRVATILMVLTPLIGVLTLAGLVTFWGAGVHIIGDNFIVLAGAPPVSERRLTGLAAAAPATLAWLAALAALFRLFDGVRRDPRVNLAAARRLKAYSFFAGLAAALEVAGSGARRWALGEYSNMPLWTHIQISSEHMTVIFTAAILFFVSVILEDANAYREEAESYV